MGSKRDLDAGSRLSACLGMALLLVGTGCGSKDDLGGSSVAALPAVNPADDGAFGVWLAANEIERSAVEPDQGTRGVSAPASGIWTLYPRGETRAEAVGSYALEISSAGFAKGGVIELRRGKTVLHREAEPFAPITRFVYGRFPSPVTEAIKGGENLSWGVYYADRPELDVVSMLRVVFKPAAERQLNRLSSDPRNAGQAALVKSLGRGQVLLNNSLFGEALSGYLAVAQEDPLVSESWTRIGDCMRRMNLKSAPLYGDALARASASSKSNARNRANPGSGDLSGADAANTARAGQVQAGQPGTSRPTSPAPTPPAAGESSETRAALGALGDMASARSAEAQSSSSDAQRSLEAAQQALAAATAALAAADEAGRNRAQAAHDEAMRREVEARLAADQAAQLAEQARADQLMMAEWRRIMGSAPALPEQRADALKAITGWAGGLRQEADAARASAEELARQAAAATSAGDPGASALIDQAQAAAQEAAEKAQAADEARAKAEQLLRLTHGAPSPR